MSLQAIKFDLSKADTTASQLSKFLRDKTPKYLVEVGVVSNTVDRMGVLIVYDTTPGPRLLATLPRHGDTAAQPHVIRLYFDEDLTDTPTDLVSKLTIYEGGVLVGLTVGNISVSGSMVEIQDVVDTASTYYIVAVGTVTGISGTKSAVDIFSFTTEA